MRLLYRRRNSYGESFIASGERPEKDRRRFPIFLLALVIGCVGGLSYTYNRSAIYEASTSIQVLPPDSAAPANDTERESRTVGIVRHALTANDLLSQLLTRLTEDPRQNTNMPRSLGELRQMINAQRFENTNIVNLRAQGPNPEILPLVVNLWADLYLETQASTQQTSVDDTNAMLDRQSDELQNRIARKRDGIDNFRKQYDIVSMQREENRVLARLKGLNNSLNVAKDEELKANSDLNAIKAAIRRGRPIVSLQDQRRIANLETREVALQAQIQDFEQKFTPKYMAIDPNIMAVVRQLKIVEQKILEVRQEARDSVLAKAEQEFASATQSARDLAVELERSKQKVSEFTTRFAEHEALTEELAQMELMYLEVKERQMRRQVDRPPEVTRVSVMQRAIEPTSPVWPDYTRDAAISVAASVVLGILAVLFYDFFNRPSRHALVPEGGHVVLGVSGRPQVVDAEVREMEVSPSPPALTHRPRRELAESEIRTLLETADEMTRPLVGVLLLGMTVEEAAVLRHTDIDLESGSIDVPGTHDRNLKLPHPLKSAFVRFLRKDAEPLEPVWADRNNHPLGPKELDALISCAAFDAGLREAIEISAETLRHTFITFLIRQGARLSELEQITGDLSPSNRASYAAYSPPGPGLASDKLIIIHPALEDF